MSSTPVTIEHGMGGAGRRMRPRLSPMVVIATVVSVAIVALLGFTLWMATHTEVTGGQFTTANFTAITDDSFSLTAIRNTFGFAVTTLLVALLFGVPLAWLVERTDFRAKGFIYVIMTMGVLIPGFISAMGWLFLFHPRFGIVNEWLMDRFGLSSAPLNVASLYGMGVVQGMGLAALIFIMTVTGLRAMDASLEEASSVSGASLFTTLRRVTLPLNMPNLFGASLFVLILAVSAFDVPAVIGLSNRIFVFSTFLISKLEPEAGLEPQYGVAAAVSVFMMAASLIASVFYVRMLAKARKYQVVTGKNYQARRLALGGWKWAAWAFVLFFVLFAKVMPLLVLFWAAFLPFLQAPSMEAVEALSFENFRATDWDAVRHGLGNTAKVMVSAPLITLAVSLAFSWVVLRTRTRFRLGFDVTAFLPIAVPPIIFAFATLVFTLRVLPDIGPFQIYGSLLVLVVIYALLGVSFGTRVTNGALIQIHSELEEAASLSGAPTRTVLRRITIPLMRPAFIFGWLWLALLLYRELTIAQVLTSAENATLPVVTYALFRSSNYGQASAVAVVMMVVIVPLMFLYLRFGGILGDSTHRPTRKERRADKRAGVQELPSMPEASDSTIFPQVEPLPDDVEVRTPVRT